MEAIVPRISPARPCFPRLAVEGGKVQAGLPGISMRPLRGWIARPACPGVRHHTSF